MILCQQGCSILILQESVGVGRGLLQSTKGKASCAGGGHTSSGADPPKPAPVMWIMCSDLDSSEYFRGVCGVARDVKFPSHRGGGGYLFIFQKKTEMFGKTKIYAVLTVPSNLTLQF